MPLDLSNFVLVLYLLLFCLGGVWEFVFFAVFCPDFTLIFFFVLFILFVLFFPFWYLHGIIGETRFRVFGYYCMYFLLLFWCSMGETAGFRVVVGEVMWYVTYIVCLHQV